MTTANSKITTHYTGLSDSPLYFEWRTSTVILVHQKLYLFSPIYLLKGLLASRLVLDTHRVCNNINLDQMHTHTKMSGWMLRSWGRLLYREAVLLSFVWCWSANFKRPEIWTQTQLWTSGVKKMISKHTDIQHQSPPKDCGWCYEFIFHDLSFLRRTVGIQFLRIIYHCKINLISHLLIIEHVLI